jgi:hypothetical protein
MGFLDELRKRADALQSKQRIDEAAFERNALLTDAACKSVFHYWLELARDLNVIRPPVRGRYVFDMQNLLDGTVEGLHFEDFRIDSRRKRMRDLELYDHVVISCWVRSERRMSIVKDFPTEIERVAARLNQAGVVAPVDLLRDEDSGKFRATRYEFDADVRVGVRLMPDHEQGKLHFTVTNFERLESLVIEFATAQVDGSLLDELAKWWLGEPNTFRSAGRIVQVIEPR